MKITRYKYEYCSNEPLSNVKHYGLKEQEIESPNFSTVDNLQRKHGEFKDSLQKVYISWLHLLICIVILKSDYE